jgi:hypothetical protein
MAALGRLTAKSSPATPEYPQRIPTLLGHSGQAVEWPEPADSRLAAFGADRGISGRCNWAPCEAATAPTPS